MTIETAKLTLAIMLIPVFIVGGLCYLITNRLVSGWRFFQVLVEDES